MEAAHSESQAARAPDREALFASSEGVKRPEFLAARAGHCLYRILRWEYYCPLVRDKNANRCNDIPLLYEK
nr:hypothetical protein [Bacillus cereus]